MENGASGIREACGDLIWSRTSTVKICSPLGTISSAGPLSVQRFFSRYVSLYQIGKPKIWGERVKVKSIPNPIFLIEV